ncbi:MAG: hypothetical protein V4726_24435 [Verrucomicrobiota bacterium]
MLLTTERSWCAHEGMGGHASFESYAAALRARPEPLAGDSSPALFPHADRLREEFPGARFAIVTRDAAQSLQALIRASGDPGIAGGWPEYLRSVVRARGELEAVSIESRELDEYGACARLYAHLLGGARLDPGRFRQLRALRITSAFPPATAPFPLPAAVMRPAPGGMERLYSAGFSAEGLAVEHFDAVRHDFVREWFEGHNGRSMPDVGLPPLGVIVSDAGGPAGALWCFETYGTGAAWIEFPVTRPGLSVADASRIMAFAVVALTELAGKGYDPPARFDRFRINCPPAMSRVVRRLGFQASAPRDNLLLKL